MPAGNCYSAVAAAGRAAFCNINHLDRRRGKTSLLTKTKVPLDNIQREREREKERERERESVRGRKMGRERKRASTLGV